MPPSLRAAAVFALAGAVGCADVLGIVGVPDPEDAAVSVDAASVDAASVADRDAHPADAQTTADPDASTACVTDGACGESTCDGPCIACIPNLLCEPANPCHVGVTTCASDQTSCVDTLANVGSGQACATYAGGTCQSGACQCPAGTTLCGTACVDVATDASHCGQCGHDCRGGTCDAGVCQPIEIVTHTELTALETNPMAIVADGVTVYYSSDTYQVPGMSMVWSVPAGAQGGIPQRITSGQPVLNNLGLGPAGLYWSNYGTPGSIALYSITNNGTIDLWQLSGAPLPVVSALQNPGNLAIDSTGTYGYFPSLGPYDGMGGTDRTNGYITQIELMTGATRPVVTGIDMLVTVPNQVAIAGPYLYWLVGDSGSSSGVAPSLGRAAIADGIQTTVDHYLSDVENGEGPVGSDNAVFWVTSSSGSSPSSGAVYTLPITAGFGTVATPLATAQNSPSRLVIDATHAYWWTPPVDPGAAGAIMRAPLDATSVYWTDTVLGVMQLAKPLD